MSRKDLLDSMSCAHQTIGPGVLILAAGFGRRYGSDKRLALLTVNHSLLEVTVALYARVFNRIIVVLRSGELELGNKLIAKLGLAPKSIFYSENAHMGMGHSIADSIKEVGMKHWTWVFIALADMPFIKEESLLKLYQNAEKKDKYGQEIKQILLPENRLQQLGHPVGFSRSFYPALELLSGDHGARNIVQNNLQVVTRVELDDPGIIKDIDTQAELCSVS